MKTNERRMRTQQGLHTHRPRYHRPETPQQELNRLEAIEDYRCLLCKTGETEETYYDEWCPEENVVMPGNECEVCTNKQQCKKLGSRFLNYRRIAELKTIKEDINWDLPF